MYFSDVHSGLTMLGRVSFNGSVPSQVLTTVQYGAVGMFSCCYCFPNNGRMLVNCTSINLSVFLQRIWLWTG